MIRIRIRCSWEPLAALAAALLVAVHALAQPIPPACVPDGAGGVIVAWEDSRYGERNIYAQRLSAAGARMWPDTGVVVCAAPGHQLAPVAVTDGAGGALIAWEDIRSGSADIYAQRLDAAGAPQWAKDGAAICTALSQQFQQAIAADGKGGAIVAWSDARSGSFDIYAQRVNAGGAIQWGVDGVVVDGETNSQTDSRIVADGFGGAVLAWMDSRAGQNADMFVQRLRTDGSIAWAEGGVPLCLTPSDLDVFPQAVSDAAGGLIASWEAIRSTGEYLVVAQRVDSTGAVRWTANGVRVSEAQSIQRQPAITSDGEGGAVVAWTDIVNLSTDPLRIDAQRIDAAGTPLWSSTAVELSPIGMIQYEQTAASDGAHGAITAWIDNRNSPSGGYTLDVFAQRLDGSGARRWGDAGVVLCDAVGAQHGPAVVGDGAGGAIAVWDDFRNGGPVADSTLYAQRLDASGAIQWPVNGVRVYYPPRDLASAPLSPPGLSLAAIAPNPTSGPLVVRFSLREPGSGMLELLDIGGRRVTVRSLAGLGAGPHEIRLGARGHLRPGLYVIRLSQRGGVLTRKACVVE
jgi:hypothetical protein